MRANRTFLFKMLPDIISKEPLGPYVRSGDDAWLDIVRWTHYALVMGEEATLKRLRRKGASVALEAANPIYETRIFGPDQVQVHGKLVGLIRRYH